MSQLSSEKIQLDGKKNGPDSRERGFYTNPNIWEWVGWGGHELAVFKSDGQLTLSNDDLRSIFSDQPKTEADGSRGRSFVTGGQYARFDDYTHLVPVTGGEKTEAIRSTLLSLANEPYWEDTQHKRAEFDPTRLSGMLSLAEDYLPDVEQRVKFIEKLGKQFVKDDEMGTEAKEAISRFLYDANLPVDKKQDLRKSLGL